MRTLLVCLISLILLSSCGSGDVSGTTTETTGEYAGIALTTDGDPIGNASVSLYNISTNEFEDTLLTNSEGQFTLEPATDATYHMRVASEDGSALCWYYFPLANSLDMIEATLSAPAPYQLSLTDAPEGVSLSLGGTPFWASVTGSKVMWGALPSGSYTLFDTTTSTIKPLGSFFVPQEMASAITLTYDTSGFLFDDFNDGDDKPLLYPLSESIKNWNVENTTTETFFDRLQADSSGGYVLHIPQTGELRKAITKIGNNVDFSTLDSISFRAKGDGILRVALEDNYSHPEDSIKKVLFKTILTPSWTTYTINVKTHADSEFFGITSWDELKSEIDYITLFMYVTENELWFDDLKLYGVDLR